MDLFAVKRPTVRAVHADALDDLLDVASMALVWAALALGFVALYVLAAGA